MLHCRAGWLLRHTQLTVLFQAPRHPPPPPALFGGCAVFLWLFRWKHSARWSQVQITELVTGKVFRNHGSWVFKFSLPWRGSPAEWLKAQPQLARAGFPSALPYLGHVGRTASCLLMFLHLPCRHDRKPVLGVLALLCRWHVLRKKLLWRRHTLTDTSTILNFKQK